MKIDSKKGKLILSQILTSQKNINIIEKNIKLISTTKSEYSENLYYVVGEIIGKKKSLSAILKNIKSKRISSNSPIYDTVKNAIAEEDDFIKNPFEVEEGILTCKCGSKRVYSYTKQCRSSDEPMSTFAQCVACNSKWVYSG
jgi:DNA-directed RNA polymerase subunit M/transcription elongation factor TFIIS